MSEQINAVGMQLVVEGRKVSCFRSLRPLWLVTICSCGQGGALIELHLRCHCTSDPFRVRYSIHLLEAAGVGAVGKGLFGAPTDELYGILDM